LNDLLKRCDQNDAVTFKRNNFVDRGLPTQKVFLKIQVTAAQKKRQHAANRAPGHRVCGTLRGDGRNTK
jgi:hypothetical protein